jgi:hypothetical protein
MKNWVGGEALLKIYSIVHSLFILFETFQIFSKKEMATIAWHNLSTLLFIVFFFFN